MQGTVAGRDLLEPRSLADAVKMLRDEGPLVPMAGCTDLYVALNFGTLRPTRFLNLWNLDALRGIEARGQTLRIGALTTYTDLITSGVIRRRLPMLAAAAREVGGVQIQNRGTLGGNVANASPAGDTLPVLLAADTVVVLRSAAGTRRVPMTSFYTGYRQTAARPDELIVSFEIPAVRGRQWFRKVGTRAAQAIAKIVVAGVWDKAPHARGRVWRWAAWRRSRFGCHRQNRHSAAGRRWPRRRRSFSARLHPSTTCARPRSIAGRWRRISSGSSVLSAHVETCCIHDAAFRAGAALPT